MDSTYQDPQLIGSSVNAVASCRSGARRAQRPPPVRLRFGKPMRAGQAQGGKVRSATDSTLLSLGKCRQGWPKGKIDAGRIPANRGGIPPDPDRSGGPGTEALAPGLTPSVRGCLLPGIRLHPARLRFRADPGPLRLPLGSLYRLAEGASGSPAPRRGLRRGLARPGLGSRAPRRGQPRGRIAPPVRQPGRLPVRPSMPAAWFGTYGRLCPQTAVGPASTDPDPILPGLGRLRSIGFR